MTTQSKEMTVAEWISVRSRVAEQLKADGSRQELGTRERIAEKLLEAGFIDVDRVRAVLADEYAAEVHAARDGDS